MLLWTVLRRPSKWRHWEVYALLVLDVIYGYCTVILFFGWGHCMSICCG